MDSQQISGSPKTANCRHCNRILAVLQQMKIVSNLREVHCDHGEFRQKRTHTLAKRLFIVYNEKS